MGNRKPDKLEDYLIGIARQILVNSGELKTHQIRRGELNTTALGINLEELTQYRLRDGAEFVLMIKERPSA